MRLQQKQSRPSSTSTMDRCSLQLMWVLYQIAHLPSLHWFSGFDESSAVETNPALHFSTPFRRLRSIHPVAVTLWFYDPESEHAISSDLVR